ncbi:MAG: symmetrical bis(5'-nucleosyl)-tetraphosphatase [Pseudomonadota bacterium]
MTDWAIGDLHGCLDEFNALCERIALDTTRDTLWLTGDLVNRGPRCLDTLRRIHALSQLMGDRLRVVLGNHDLHLLACWSGLRHPGPGDTLASILDAPDVDQLCDWLRRQPLIHRESDAVLVHAGLFPGLSFADNLAMANALHRGLSGDDARHALEEVYRRPAECQPPTDTRQAVHFAAASLTRMRCLNTDGSLNFKEKGAPDSLPVGVTPWYAAASAAFADVHIHTGHWAALGYGVYGPVVALDGGCVWGGELVAVNRRLPHRPVRVQRGEV